MSKPVTASQVRETLRKSSKFAGLSEQAQHTLANGARGRLHPEAIVAFNKGRKADSRYAPGATAQVRAAAKAEAKAVRESLAASGVKVGTRGPLPKVALSQSK